MSRSQPLWSLLGLVLAVAVVGCQLEPQAAAPTQSKRSKVRSADKDPIPAEPIDDEPPDDATPGPDATPQPTPAPTAPPVVATPTPGPTATPVVIEPAAPSLLGRILVPAAMISNNGGGLISNNGGGIVSNNGGGLISDRGGGYRVLAVSQGALANAFLYLTDRDEKFFLDAQTKDVFTATSDAEGRYAFPITAANGFPVGKDVVVNVLVNDNQRLTGYMRPVNGVNELVLGLGTTLATEFLRGDAYARGRALGAYDATRFQELASLTQAAIVSGDLPAVTQSGGRSASAFDLQMHRVGLLRDQYEFALSVADKGNAAIKRLSDAWKALIGRRPAAVTTVAGNGALPASALRPYPPNVEGDWRGGASPSPLEVPIGTVRGLAVSARGDVFVSADGPDVSDAHVRWLKPSGAVSSLWIPGWNWRDARGLIVEKEPTESTVGTLLVAGGSVSLLWRLPIVDTELKNGDAPVHPVEILSGLYTSTSDPEHPEVVDGAVYPPTDGTTPLRSAWRLEEEGPRRYRSNGQLVPNPARYAHLGGIVDVSADELGNLYVVEQSIHRVRMIVGAAGDGQNFYGYRQPFDDDGDGLVDRYDATPTPMRQGCIYTIAGAPSWDATRTAASSNGRWYGEYGGDGGRAQLAKLDTPKALAFKDGYLYVCDSDNQRIRRIERGTGTIETIAGAPGARNAANHDYPPGFAGDGGPATAAQLSYPSDIAFDAAGRLYIADAGFGRIRMVDAGGRIQTVAGRVRLNGDNVTDNIGAGAARSVDLYGLGALAPHPDGNLLFGDSEYLRVRKLWRQWE